MAKPSLFDHPKFKRLVHLLRMPEPHVYGHLEYVWRVAYASGNPVIGDEVDVELAAQWQGEPGQFAKALLEVRLLDIQKKTGKLQVHDLFDHAPDYVASRFRMSRYRKRKCYERLRNGYASNTALPSLALPCAPNPPHTNENPDCSEPPTAASEPPVMIFPCVGKGPNEWPLLPSKVTEFRQSFPGIDILAECRKARQWCIDNPAKRKTFGGMARFLSGWLGRAQDKPRPSANGKPDYRDQMRDTLDSFLKDEPQ